MFIDTYIWLDFELNQAYCFQNIQKLKTNKDIFFFFFQSI